MGFDVTEAVRDWSEHPKNNFGVQVWIESARPGHKAVRTARKTRFVKPNGKKVAKRPELVISFSGHKDNSANSVI